MKAIIYKTFFLLIFLGLFTYLNTSAQEYYVPKLWDKTLGGNNLDELTSILAIPEGGFLVGGSSSSNKSRDKSEDTKGVIDYWIVKINNDGSKVWDKTLGGFLEDSPTIILVTSDGGFIVGGYSRSNKSGDKSENSRGANDYWIIKIDAQGNKIWDKTFGGDDDDLLSSILPTSDGGFIVGGWSRSNKSGDKSENSRGVNDYWIIKIDAQGNKIWDKTFGGDGDDYLYSILGTSDGGFLLGGNSKSNKSGNKSENSKGKEDFWLIKIDKNGNKIWDKIFGGADGEVLRAGVITLDGGFLFGGESWSNKSGDKSENSKGYGDYWIVKIDKNGNKIWDKTLGGNYVEKYSTKSIITTSDGGFVLGGNSESNKSGDKSENSKGGVGDYWIVKIDKNGNKIWDKTLGGSDWDELTCMVATSDDGFLLGGRSQSNEGGDKTESSGGVFDYWLIKLGKEIKDPNQISGSIFQVNDTNCDELVNTPPLAGWIIKIEPGSNYAISDSLGKYTLFSDKGTYTLSQTPPVTTNLIFKKQICPTQPYSVFFDGLGKPLINYNFGLDVNLCALLKVDVSSNPRRRCFPGKTTITYQNEGIAKAENVQLEVDFPEFVIPLKSSVPWTAKKGKTLIFNLGTLQAGEQKRIVITDSVACVEQARGLSQCVEARISPKNTCLAPNPNWNGASLELRGKCFLLTEPIAQIVLKNTGKANMSQASKYRIFANDSLLPANTVQLIAGDSLLLEFPTQGLSIRVEAEQVPLHPNPDLLSVSVEGCNLVNNQNPQNQGFVNRFIQADANLEKEIDCQLVVDSFDPNDKLVSPEGITEKHYVKPDTRLEYTLRFQNTGTAEAINIQVVDTLSSNFNFETFEMMSASHPYQLEVRGSQKQVLIFKFPNINLPDSTSNELQSHGFIKFKISPKANLAVGTIVKNFADIYFDYNEPVRTNVTEINYTDYQFPVVKSLNPCKDIKDYAPKKPLISQKVGENKINVDISNATYQWFRNGVLLPQNTQAIDLNQSGEYEVIVSKNGCVSEKSAKFSFVVTALSEFEKQTRITIYPNPSQGNLNLKMANTLTKELKVSVLHSSGKIVWQKSFQTDAQIDWETSLNLNHLPQGLYFLEIENSKGKSVKKIIVEK